MAQIKKSYQEIKIPLSKVTFSPDVPSAALAPTEFNVGENVETDVRGVRSVSGDAWCMPPVPNSPATFVTGGYRQPCGDDDNDWYFITATEAGVWWATNGSLWQEITPLTAAGGSYTQDQNITEAWAGTVPIFNDEQSPPMFWPEDAGRKALLITGASGDGATVTLTFDAQATAPFEVGQEIAVYNTQPVGYTGVWTVTACTTTTVEYSDTETGTWVPNLSGPNAIVADPLPRMIQYSNQLPIDIFQITAPTSSTRNLTFAGVCETQGSSISGTTLTVGTMTLPGLNRAALMAPGMWLSGTGITAGTKVIRNISGQGDGSTWEVNISQTVASTDITGYPWGTAGVGPSAPFVPGEYIRLTDVQPRYYDGRWLVTACDEDSVTIENTVLDAHTDNTGQINPDYSWNYNPNWSSVYAKFLRIYNTPNVGSILVAGNLTATNVATDETEFYPVTVQWSQNFGLNQAPVTWTPTTTNIANQLEVPVRGDALDGFPCNGNFFVSSYWDTVVFSPLNYATTATPILGVRQFNQGRGLLNPNCWANADQKVYGIDARDVWVFDGNTFQGLGNQRVKNWLFNEIDPAYYSRVYMEVNTSKNQVEIYYPTVAALAGVPNKMISYRYDLDVWNPPRSVTLATFACEAPVWTSDHVYLNKTEDSTTGSGFGFEVNILRGWNTYSISGDTLGIIQPGQDYAPGDTLTFLGDTLGGVTPTNDAVFTVLEVTATGGILSGLWSGTPAQNWRYDPASRCVVYALAAPDRPVMTKDQGYAFQDPDTFMTVPIDSLFVKDNIKFLEDYSGKLMVHRMLPEVVNLDSRGLEIDPTLQANLIGSVTIQVSGANSVGQPALQSTLITVDTDTNDPWAQIGQNAHRVNSISISDSASTAIWMITQLSFQLTQTEDDR